MVSSMVRREKSLSEDCFSWEELPPASPFGTMGRSPFTSYSPWAKIRSSFLTPIPSVSLASFISIDSPEGPQALWMMRLGRKSQEAGSLKDTLNQLLTCVGYAGQWMLGVGSGGSLKKVTSLGYLWPQFK